MAQPVPKIPLEAGKSKEIPTELSVELSGVTLPAIPSLLGTGKLLPAHLLILAALPGTAFPFQDRAATTGCVHLSGAVFKALRARTFLLQIPVPPARVLPEHQPWVAKPGQALELNL